jgi:hypothetical protein
LIQNPEAAGDMAGFLKDKMEGSRDFDAKLNILYVIHDVLHHSFRLRGPNDISDAFSDAFLPHLGAILRSTYGEAANGGDPERVKKVRVGGISGVMDIRY